MNKPKFETLDMVEKNIEKLAEIFPNCITEARDENGKLKKAVNFEMLQQILSTEFPPRGFGGAVRVHLGGEACGYC